MKIALATSVLLAAISGGCSKDEPAAEARRAVLRPDDVAQKRATQKAKLRVRDDKGNLLPSTEKFAGVVLPRGMVAVFTFEKEIWYDAPAPLHFAEKYFAENLDAITYTRPSNGTLVFSGTRAKGDPDAPRVTVTLQRVNNRPELTRVAIRELASPDAPRKTAAEIKADLERRRARPE